MSTEPIIRNLSFAEEQSIKSSDTQQILEAIAALADGLRARDAQLTAMSEQVRQGFADLNHFLNSEVIARNSRQTALEEKLGQLPAWIFEQFQRNLNREDVVEVKPARQKKGKR